MNVDRPESLGTRAAHARLLVAEIVQQKGDSEAAERAEQLRRRISNAAESIATQDHLVGRLVVAGVEAAPLPARTLQSATRARRALRTAATKLKDPENGVRDLVSTKSVNDAVGSAERIIQQRDSSIERSFSDFRDRKRPHDLEEVLPDGLQPLSLALKVKRLKHVLGATGTVSAGDVLAELEKYLSALESWEDLRPEIAAAQQRVSPALEAFLREVPNGVPWKRINSEIRDWLNSGSNGESYVVVRRDRLT